MSRLTDLILKTKAKDPQLGADLEREFKALSSRRSFGLNFERHKPEAVELPQRPLRKGDKVRILPERGSLAKSDQRLWVVRQIKRNKDARVAELDLLGFSETEEMEVDVNDLVVIAEFRDPVFPGMVSTGTVEKGGLKPFHTVINGENYHVLNALTYTHRGKIDLIYIDPPYNTGAKDWKYNNNYVEELDLYRHSKWLSFIERRLQIAKQLLNAENSVLIVTIDEKEYLRLGMLLEQTFPEGRIQMISSVINPKGVPRDGLSRVDEYIFLIQFGAACITGDVSEGSAGKEVRWRSLTRTGSNGVRGKSPGAFYPIYFNHLGELVGVGEALPLNVSAKTVKPQANLIAVWPTPRPDGEDGRWSVVPETLQRLIKIGGVKVGRVNVEKGKFPISYLTSNQLKAIENGDLEVRGKTHSGILNGGTLNVYYKEDGGRISSPRTVWDKVSHSASEHGSMLLRSLIPGRKFPYPKSLYAVEDVIRIFLASNKSAVVLDFFSGSGTTSHAVMRLNRQDNGRRQSISVTNNEVAADEQLILKKKALRPGDPEWEKWGICDYITKPRVKAAITGRTPEGEPISGDYKFNEEFPMSEGFNENAEFFTLTYESPISISHNYSFEKIAPLLWMRAGSVGERINSLPTKGWKIADTYGVLTNLDLSSAFVIAVKQVRKLRIAYIVTNDDRRFQAISKELPDTVEPVRLYESYLTNFQFVNGE